MKIVIDEDLPRSVRKTLQSLGYEVLDVRDHGLRGKSDEDVFRFAQSQKAVLCTADLGFSNILHFPLGTHFGIVLIRVSNEMRSLAINTLILSLLPRAEEIKLKGKLVVLSPQGLRIRGHRSV